MPRVSVLVRTKDRPWFLARALQDIAGQRFTDLEVLVIDDGDAHDATAAVVAASDIAARARVIRPAGPGGRCAAANAGIEQATGEFLVLHDDDDLWHPAFLERTVAWLDRYPADIGVITRTEIAYERFADGQWQETQRVPFWAELSQISLIDMLAVNRAVPISFLYRRAAHDEVGGYDERLDAVEDWEFSLRLLVAHTIGFIPEALAVWTQRPSAQGDAANSMFALAGEHRRDDAIVRDRALREWIAREGEGLPLMIAGEFAALRTFVVEQLNRELDRRHPFSALARKAVFAWRRRRGTRR